MEWITTIKEAIAYMEEHLLTIQGPEEVAQHVSTSTMYLQSGFQILTGTTIGEYIRNRRLYLAAIRLATSQDKIITVAMDFGYETPESFTKAFTRFHGASPSEVRKDTKKIRTFLPLRVNIVIQGGNGMDYSVEKKDSFKVIGFVRKFSFDTSYVEIPKFWDEMASTYAPHLSRGQAPLGEIEEAIARNHIGEYGICLDDVCKDNQFRYLIGGRYDGGKIPEGMEVIEIPESDWAVFDCYGPLPASMQSVNTKIFKEFMPGNKDFDFPSRCTVEWYSSNSNPQGDEYHSAIWIPVTRK